MVDENNKIELLRKKMEQARLDLENEIALQKEEERKLKLKLEEERRIAEERRIVEERRIAEERRIVEERRIAEEKKAAEEIRIVEERRVAEEQKLLEKQKFLEENLLKEKAMKEIEEEKRIMKENQNNETKKVTFSERTQVHEIERKENNDQNVMLNSEIFDRSNISEHIKTRVKNTIAILEDMKKRGFFTFDQICEIGDNINIYNESNNVNEITNAINTLSKFIVNLKDDTRLSFSEFSKIKKQILG